MSAPSPPSGTTGIPITNFGRRELTTDGNSVLTKANDDATAYFDNPGDSDVNVPTPKPSFAPRTKKIKDMITKLKGVLGKTDKNSARKINDIITVLNEITDDAKKDFTTADNRDPARSDQLREDIYTSKFQENDPSKVLTKTIGWVNTKADETEATLYDVANKGSDIPCDTAGREKIENKLQKCFDLEILYLRKHSELIKVFGFTLDLYDKFRKSTRLLLYLLKHLIYDTGLEGDTVVPPNSQADGDIADSIKIPKPVIKNIKELIKDQQAIQTLMTQMKKVVNDSLVSTDLEGVLKTKLPSGTTAPASGTGTGPASGTGTGTGPASSS